MLPGLRTTWVAMQAMGTRLGLWPGDGGSIGKGEDG